MGLVWILLSLVAGNILQLIGFVSEELVYFFLVFYDSLGYDLTVLDE